jgi:hypothetical protein
MLIGVATLVYRYGTRNHWDAPPEIVEQMRLANHLRNNLVEIEHGHDDAMRAMWSQHPEVAEAETELAAAEDAVAAAVDATKSDHQRDRSRTTKPARSAEVTAARSRVKAAKAARRQAISNVYASAKDQIEQIRSDRKAAIKATYPKYSQTGDGLGLYWGTYGHILDHHKVAVQRIASDRKKGNPADLRFHRFDGSGTIRVQVMHQAGDPQRTPTLLASGESKWRNVIGIPPQMAADPAEWNAKPRCERRRDGRATMTVTLGGGRQQHHVDVPVTVHRPLPPDSDVCFYELTRRRVAGRYETAVCITVRVPDPEPADGGPAVALHLGWRSRGDGSVRVGTLATTGTLPPTPADLDGFVVRHGTWGEIIIPASMLDIAGRPASVQKRRDLSFEPMRDKLADWLSGHGGIWDGDDAPWPRLVPHLVRRWKAPGRLAAVAHAWRDNTPDGAADILAALEDWRRQDRHLWEWESNERQQITRRRDETYRRVGAWVTSTAGLLIVDDSSIAELRKRGDVAETDRVLPGVAEDAARARAHLVAPGRLRQTVVGAAKTRGVETRTVKAAGLSRTHTACGHDNPPDRRFAAGAVVACLGCGNTYDQDRNAVTAMLASG